MGSVKVIPGKDVGDGNGDFTNIEFKINSNSKVAGYGVPITMALCRQIVTDYHARQNEIHARLGDILTQSSATTQLRESVSAEHEIVSGIYGRDTLLHILEQPNCEGIMYINCYYQSQNSIVLVGVDKDGQPIGGAEKFLDNNPPENLVLYEVKGGSKTRAEINSMIGGSNNPDENADGQVTDQIFKGIFKH